MSEQTKAQRHVCPQCGSDWIQARAEITVQMCATVCYEDGKPTWRDEEPIGEWTPDEFECGECGFTGETLAEFPPEEA